MKLVVGLVLVLVGCCAVNSEPVGSTTLSNGDISAVVSSAGVSSLSFDRTTVSVTGDRYVLCCDITVDSVIQPNDTCSRQQGNGVCCVSDTVSSGLTWISFF